MITFNRLVVTFIAITATQCASAASTLEDLVIFKSGGMTQGLWRMELLSSSDPMLSQGASAVGKMSICADVAKQMSKNNQLDEQNCKPRLLRNSKDAAEVDVTCQDGTHSHLKLNRENDKSYLIDSEMTSKDGNKRSLQARYSYEGECKSDAVIQLDKNSSACKKMSSMDTAKLAEMCAKAPDQYRAQCEQQMKQMGNLCQ